MTSKLSSTEVDKIIHILKRRMGHTSIIDIYMCYQELYFARYDSDTESVFFNKPKDFDVVAHCSDIIYYILNNKMVEHIPTKNNGPGTFTLQRKAYDGNFYTFTTHDTIVLINMRHCWNEYKKTTGHWYYRILGS